VLLHAFGLGAPTEKPRETDAMETETYFVIVQSEGSSPRVHQLTRAELEERLNTSYYGDPRIITDIKKWDMETQCGIAIIKGKAIRPKAVEVVKRIEVE
jgi:hypothetical protein